MVALQHKQRLGCVGKKKKKIQSNPCDVHLPAVH